MAAASAAPRKMPPPQQEQQYPPPLMSSSYSDDMAAFYAAWAVREEELAAALTSALPSRRRDALVAAALDHVAAYYEHKSRLADRDVVAALDPHWLNPLERTFLWAWGWKPALVFRFLNSNSAELEALRAATSAAEREVEREVAAVQESLAGPRVLAALRRQAPARRDGEPAAAAHDDAVDAVGRVLRVLLGSADALRERTVRGVVALLAPDQAAAFVAAMLTFHISVRRAGRDWSSSAHHG
ncbi:hypothetical protein PR202_ga23073 [Eleusine coracana subsp. coracana]|uniref:DOG1 domain-containing protein n=1 Tax=Eleusine coracana subsp. coracana TaxID=191504 RepID=A0AAV5D4D3_ELECO|nr:hypothetical protein QOZ80_1AG0014270 [Eleusine coracana subsp. coracana]GJN05447.1 hypothetical protein PR202_ga23073 [Eleusine coracana subsp. coracana]